LPIYVGGLLRRGLRREREWIAKYGISEAEMEAMVEAVVEALVDEVLTRKELTTRVVSLWSQHAQQLA